MGRKTAGGSSTQGGREMQTRSGVASSTSSGSGAEGAPCAHSPQAQTPGWAQTELGSRGGHRQPAGDFCVRHPTEPHSQRFSLQLGPSLLQGEPGRHGAPDTRQKPRVGRARRTLPCCTLDHPWSSLPLCLEPALNVQQT